MRLREKLDRLSSPPGGPESSAVVARGGLADEDADRIARLRSLIGEVVARDRRKSAAARSAGEPEPLPIGERVDGPGGSYHRVARFLEPHHCHGKVRVARALSVDPSSLATLALDRRLSQVDLSRILILDTETTGLAGGTGTVPFLVGLAWFEDGALCIEQLFLHNLGEEGPLLRRLNQRLEASSCLVTYNGKSFDWPLLCSRFVLNRVAMCEPPLHLDLLHCARRVLKPRLQSVRLTEVERELLSFYREDDIDGSLIPALYLSYLRGGDPRGLLAVFEHNDHDLVALAAVIAELVARFEKVGASEAVDQLAFARLALRARDEERADLFACAAAEGGESAELRHGAMLVRAIAATRRGDVDAAIEAWRCALAIAGSALAVSEAHLALAKLYEHRAGDLVAARRHALGTEAAEGTWEHGRRLGRLHRRLLQDRERARARRRMGER